MVHYVRYSNEFDEWVPISEIINKSSSVNPADILPVSINDFSILRHRIKESLTLYHRMDTRISLIQPITMQTWSVLSPQLEILKVFPKNPTVYTADKQALSNLLNDKFWYRRIINEAGDKASINMKTLQLSCTNKKPIQDYTEKDENSFHESGLHLKLQFVIEHNKYFS